MASRKDSSGTPKPLSKHEFEELAMFRAALRRYLRFSERIIREHGLTPQQYQLLLAIKGFPGRDWATVSELAEQLEVRHHSVVELVDRAQQRDLVERASHPTDARVVRVLLTTEGDAVLDQLSALHRDRLGRMDSQSLVIPFSDAAFADRSQDRSDHRPADRDAKGDGRKHAG